MMTLLCYVSVCVYPLLRADSDRAKPYENTVYNGEGVPTGHAGGATARPQHCARHVSLPGPADQDTLSFFNTTSSAAQQQPAAWIQLQLHHSTAGRHTARAGIAYTHQQKRKHLLDTEVKIYVTADKLDKS